MGSVIAISGVALLALAITLFRGPSQGGAPVIGGVLIGVGLWMQRRKSIDGSPAHSGEETRAPTMIEHCARAVQTHCPSRAGEH